MHADLHMRGSVMAGGPAAPTSIEAALASFANMGITIPELAMMDGEDMLLSPRDAEGDNSMQSPPKATAASRISTGKAGPTAAIASLVSTRHGNDDSCSNHAHCCDHALSAPAAAVEPRVL